MILRCGCLPVDLVMSSSQFSLVSGRHISSVYFLAVFNVQLIENDSGMRKCLRTHS